ncbi:hypothetical protein E2C01_007496 [Portunus trituberculatus]|uniref:Uncharacterized protein n=1 Tax=Portunus trituberculatus TaxID=210409 RepID=A0A5B7D1B4_PORTR|nr:hypothetical protein [Portunus trituberculatus]
MFLAVRCYCTHYKVFSTPALVDLAGLEGRGAGFLLAFPVLTITSAPSMRLPDVLYLDGYHIPETSKIFTSSGELLISRASSDTIPFTFTDSGTPFTLLVRSRSDRRLRKPLPRAPGPYSLSILD